MFLDKKCTKPTELQLGDEMYFDLSECTMRISRRRKYLYLAQGTGYADTYKADPLLRSRDVALFTASRMADARHMKPNISPKGSITLLIFEMVEVEPQQ